MLRLTRSLGLALLLASCLPTPLPALELGGVAAGTDAAMPEVPGPSSPPDGGALACPAWPAPACDAADISGRLRCITGLSIDAQILDQGGVDFYELSYEQPTDHDAPDAGTFRQRLTLLVRSADAPLVLNTSGYGLDSRRSEVSRLVGGNELSYEHRFFGPSTPQADRAWRTLRIRQAAHDAHRLALAFHWLFPGTWLSTGISKGGMTSLYHRRFHPCDVDGTIAYSTPWSTAVEDERYPQFLEDVGGPARAACRQAITRFSIDLLEHPEAYTGGVEPRAFESAVVALAFRFWAHGDPDDPFTGCVAIPPVSAAAAQKLTFLSFHAPPDAEDPAYEPYYFQALAELGAPASALAPFAGLIRFPAVHLNAALVVSVPHPAFDPQPLAEVGRWVEHQAQQVLFVYGANDPWSARGYPASPEREVHRLVVDDGNHRARLGELRGEARATAIAALERWTHRPLAEAPSWRASPAEEPSEPAPTKAPHRSPPKKENRP